MHQHSFPLQAVVVGCWTALSGEVLSKTKDHVFRDQLGDCLLSLAFGLSPGFGFHNPINQLESRWQAGNAYAYHTKFQQLCHSAQKCPSLQAIRQLKEVRGVHLHVKVGTCKGLPTIFFSEHFWVLNILPRILWCIQKTYSRIKHERSKSSIIVRGLQFSTLVKRAPSHLK